MNRESRTRLRRVVSRARALLEEDVKTQLNRFGIEEGGNAVPIGRLGHLGPNDAELRAKILASINKEQGKRIELSEAYDRYVRHVGFTYLNRIAALRAMEVRELLDKETVIQRDKYAGLSERAYEISERRGISNSGESTRLCFLEAFGEVSNEIKVLFDVNDEYSVLFPSSGVLEKVIELIGVDMPEDDWREEDVIGWIYQYYNSEAREELRKKRRKLRADDVPVVNQFYTSHWLVRALVDNTLGRLWLEMKVRMPKPGNGVAPSPEHLKNPHGNKVDDYCSYLIPSRQEPPVREQKPVRDIKVLDPACGSGHFLVYAFNVLYRMYLEDEPQTPKEEIPRLILENNLFGIDIDFRSVQLAALSLYLKAKEYNRNAKITKMNLVCADVRIINGDLKKTFLKSLEPDVDLQKIFVKLFEELAYTFDIGSLLKVRTPFERLIKERGPQSHFQVRPSGQTSFSVSGIAAQTSIHFDGPKGAAHIQPAVALNEMLEALASFEKEGLNKGDMGSMLFAAEAEKSVGLLTLLSQKYDIIVMNPPYGDLPETASSYVKAHYPRTHHDYYAAFIEQAIDLCDDNGFVGMLTGRTFMFLKRFEKIRTEILLKEARSEIIFDLNSSAGDNILDEATARWASTIARKIPGNNDDTECIFVRLTPFEGEDNKIAALEEAVGSWLTKNEDGECKIFVTKKLVTLKKLPRMPYSYWISESIANFFEKYPPLDRDNAGKISEAKIGDLRQGLATADDNHFTRYWWEVNTNTIASSIEETFEGRKWVPFVKGGKAYYSDIPMVVNWENNGKEIKQYIVNRYPYLNGNWAWVAKNEDFYFKEGLCWSDVISSVLMDFRILPKGTIFGHKAHTLFLPSSANYYKFVGLLNSSLLAGCQQALDATMHNRAIGYICQLPISNAIFESEEIGKQTKAIESLKQAWETGEEVSYNFTKPWILQELLDPEKELSPLSGHPLSESFAWPASPLSSNGSTEGKINVAVRELTRLCVIRETQIREKILGLQKSIDEMVYNIYHVSKHDRKIIELELDTLRKFTGEESNGKITKPQISEKEHVKRLLAYYVKTTLEVEPDGIILFGGLLQKIKKRITIDFGKEKSERIECEIAQILGKTIEEWIIDDYFDFHLSHYERRPIFWHLTSASFSSNKRTTGAFNCLLHYHRLSKDTLPKIRMRQEYLKGILDGARWRAEGLGKELQKGNLDARRDSHVQTEYIEAQAENAELQAFDQKLAEVSNPRTELTKLDKNANWVEQKIAEVRDNGWNPVIDYGVRVNIEPLKEAMLLHPAADRVK